MDNHERSTLEQILNLLHGLIGRDDAKGDFRPDLTFVGERKNVFQFVPGGKEKPAKMRDGEPGNSSQEENVEFTEQEIRQMDKTFQRIIRLNGKNARIRKRTKNNNVYYEIRYRKDGYNISASATTKDEAKKRFIERVKTAVSSKPITESVIPDTFEGFTLYFFENFRIRKISATTYKNDLAKLKTYVFPKIGAQKLKQISALEIQSLLDNMLAQGMERSCVSLRSLLNVIFEAAQSHYLIVHNPIKMTQTITHEYKHSNVLTKEEERILLDAVRGTPYELIFAVALYTGMRPNEYATAKIVDSFIVCKNSKRKKGKEEQKKIPISPMLRPYLEGVTNLYFYRVEHIRDKLRSILSTHILYDLRKTFYNRCIECGVVDAARDEFFGHSHGALKNTYTELGDDFLLREGEKLKY